MAITRIFVTKDAALAATTAGFWENQGYTILPIGPTDRLEVAEADGSAAHWESDAGPCYAIVVTRDAAATP